MVPGLPAHAIAIVGMAARLPGARSLDEFWLSVRNGVEVLETFSDAQLDDAGVDRALQQDPRFVRRGTTLADADQFAAEFFGLPPREAQTLDPQQRIFLECAWEALEHAGHGPGTIQQVTGVYAGAGMNTYLLTCIARDPAMIAAVGGYQLMLGNDKDFLSTRVSYKLDLHGPSLSVQTACSTSLVAVQLACRALEHGECDMAIAGGVSVLFPQTGGYLFQEGMILSPDGQCRPFDKDARGTRPGSGCAVVVLKRLTDAIAQRDTIHAVIRGAAVNNDGAMKAGFTAPSIDGQIEVIATAQMLAGVDPRTVGYVEAHGTGTPLGDPIEVAALTQVFRASTADVGFCHLGSLKATHGHLDAAAGAASLIKAVLALKHREIPPLVNFREANPQLGLETGPFVVATEALAWDSTGPRRAGVSSFGIGGTNAHVVLEEAPPQPVSASDGQPQVIVVSARTGTALASGAAEMARYLRGPAASDLADIAWTSQVGRQAFPHRCAVVAATTEGAAAAFERAAGTSIVAGVHDGGTRPVAFLFSGQGSQHAGMGRRLYDTQGAYRDVVDRCADLLMPHVGCDVRAAMYGSPDSTAIHETRLAQPALFVTELALSTLWMRWGVSPIAMMGHSIGEYVAAHLAGVMSLESALALVAARGRIMQGMAAGAMAAVHLGAARLQETLGADVEVAAINSPALCTIAGPVEAIAEAIDRLSVAGVDTRLLHTSHAFHSRAMEPAAAAFLAEVEKVELAAPAIRYISNVTGTWITPQEATSPRYYATHLRRPVQFADGMRRLASNDAWHFLEVGPGNALATLAVQNLSSAGASRVVATLGHPRDRRTDDESMLTAAARLWASGVPLDWQGIHAGLPRRRVPLPTYPFERKRFWVNAAAPAAAKADAVPARSVDVGDWMYAPGWLPEETPGEPRSASGAWLILGEMNGLSRATAAFISAAGGRAVHVERAADVAAVGKAIRADGTIIRGAIVLSTLVPDSRTPAATDTFYHDPVTLADGLAVTTVAPVHVVIATAAAVSVLGEKVRNAAANLALGPALALPAEVPGLSMRVVDVDTPGGTLEEAGTCAALVAEALCVDSERVVAYRGGRRWTRSLGRCVLPVPAPEQLPIRRGGVYLITGGQSGMGLALAKGLSARESVRLVLTSRTPLPAREEWDRAEGAHRDDRVTAAIRTIREIEQSGSEVMTVAADVTDLDAMEAVLADVHHRWGQVNGVVHAAGVAGTGRLAFTKSRADVASVLAPKVDGLQVLVRALGHVSLDFVVVMSSINALVGAPGLADYCAANAWLDAFVDSDRRPAAWRRVIALDWTAWRDVGMAARQVVHRSRQEEWNRLLELGIGSAEGVDAFERALASRRSRFVVSPFDATRALAPNPAWPRQTTSTIRAADDVPRHDEPGGAAPDGDVEQRLCAMWCELLGVERVGTNEDFFALGGHSLLATRVLARIDESFGVRLSLRDVFEAPTVSGLAARIGAASSPATVDEREEIEF